MRTVRTPPRTLASSRLGKAKESLIKVKCLNRKFKINKVAKSEKETEAGESRIWLKLLMGILI